MGVSCGSFLRRTCDHVVDRCCRLFPCLSDPARRAALLLKITLVILHLVIAGVLFLFDHDLVEKSKEEPCYVLDAKKAVDERDASARMTLLTSKQPASSKNGNVAITMDGRNYHRGNATAWAKLVLDLYPLGTSTRWYICEETALCIWTIILFIGYLRSNISKAWWADVIMILLLAALSISLIFLLLLLLFHSYLIMTNQTTYELVRRRRIVYLRGVFERVFPFNQGICWNLYLLRCVRSSMYRMESLPTTEELEEKSRPYTCSDLLSCRCC